MKQWIVLQTKPRSEQRVETYLHQRGYETYFPIFSPSYSHTQQKSEPFFPTYLFVRLNPQVAGLSDLSWIPGLRRVVTFDGKFAILPDQTITLIQRKLKAYTHTQEIKKTHFEAGDDVRIMEGPFQDMVAVFEGPSTPSERVHILLTYLGRVNRIRISADALEKVSSDDRASQTKRPRRTRGRNRPIKREQ